MNLKVSHYIILVLSAAVAICAYVATQFPAEASMMNAVAGICTQLMAVLGILSPGAGSASNSSSSSPTASAPSGGVQTSVASATAAGAAALQAVKS